MIKGNKGEWSEPYTLLKLLAEGKLHLGGKNFEKIEDLFYPIIRIIRHERKNNVHFSYDDNIVVVRNGSEHFKIPIADFIKYSKLCLDKINSVKSKKGSFAIPEIEQFLNSFSINSLKSKSKNKQDITIQLNDPKFLFSPTLGFSIKSQLGQSATLVNASNATNFTYVIKGELTNSQIETINNTRLFAKKITMLKSYGCELIFDYVDNEIFLMNLYSIDYNFPRILSDVILYYYGNNIAKNNNIPYFINLVTQKNDFGYNLKLNDEIYVMMMKRFLTEYALGMRASEIWKRDYQASGGYLIVKEDGDIICYHFYFVKQFEDYLFNNTKLETPDPKRYLIGKVFQENGNLKLKLNLQIRFIK